MGVGLGFLDLFVGAFFIVLLLWVVVLGAAAIGTAFIGGVLIVGPLMPAVVIIPPMPYGGAVILGVAVIAFAVLLAVVTRYSWALMAQIGRAYRRWHRNTLTDAKYPPLDAHPTLKDKTRRRLRSVALIALVVFGVGFVIGFAVLSVSAGALGFWHVWHWFV